MKKFLFYLLMLCSSAHAQVSYQIKIVDVKKITRNASQDLVIPVYLKAQIPQSLQTTSNYVDVSVVSSETTLLPSSYTFNFQRKYFNQLSISDSSQNVGFLIIKKDTTADRQRAITLKINRFVNGVEDTTNSASASFKILVDGIKSADSLKTYSYLAYVGTNFDLVDGLQARNLFFATNIFVRPSSKKGNIGMFLSLYGNRTMTVTDSSGITRRVSKMEPASATTTRVITEQSIIVRNRVSDNIGAYISPLIKLYSATKSENQLQLYYTPSLEFVWRRTQMTTVYTNPSDQDTTIQNRVSTDVITFPTKSATFRNEFAFNVGAIAFMLVHETENISVRVHCSVGYSSYFLPNSVRKLSPVDDNSYISQGDIFFSGRAWITEPYTGITLQAEITNTLKNPRPFYGVTLSKAIDFKNIGTIFKPLTQRN